MVIADDGSDPEHVAAAQETWWEGHPIIDTPRLGCGAALAAGVRYVVENDIAPVVFFGQDDWELTEPLDLAPSLGLIREEWADVVRLGPTHPALAFNVARTPIPGAEWCPWYDWRGGGYVIGWRPALYRTEWLAGTLDGLEGMACIEAERVWLERVASGFPLPSVYHAPNTTLAGPFRHLDTVELGEDPPEVLTERYANA